MGEENDFAVMPEDFRGFYGVAGNIELERADELQLLPQNAAEMEEMWSTYYSSHPLKKSLYDRQPLMYAMIDGDLIIRGCDQDGQWDSTLARLSHEDGVISPCDDDDARAWYLKMLLELVKGARMILVRTVIFVALLGLGSAQCAIAEEVDAAVIRQALSESLPKRTPLGGMAYMVAEPVAERVQTALAQAAVPQSHWPEIVVPWCLADINSWPLRLGILEHLFYKESSRAHLDDAGRHAVLNAYLSDRELLDAQSRQICGSVIIQMVSRQPDAVSLKYIEELSLGVDYDESNVAIIVGIRASVAGFDASALVASDFIKLGKDQRDWLQSGSISQEDVSIVVARAAKIIAAQARELSPREWDYIRLVLDWPVTDAITKRDYETLAQAIPPDSVWERTLPWFALRVTGSEIDLLQNLVSAGRLRLAVDEHVKGPGYFSPSRTLGLLPIAFVDGIAVDEQTKRQLLDYIHQTAGEPGLFFQFERAAAMSLLLRHPMGDVVQTLRQVSYLSDADPMNAKLPMVGAYHRYLIARLAPQYADGGKVTDQMTSGVVPSLITMRYFPQWQGSKTFVEQSSIGGNFVERRACLASLYHSHLVQPDYVWSGSIHELLKRMAGDAALSQEERMHAALLMGSKYADAAVLDQALKTADERGLVIAMASSGCLSDEQRASAEKQLLKVTKQPFIRWWLDADDDRRFPAVAYGDFVRSPDLSINASLIGLRPEKAVTYRKDLRNPSVLIGLHLGGEYDHVVQDDHKLSRIHHEAGLLRLLAELDLIELRSVAGKLAF